MSSEDTSISSHDKQILISKVVAAGVTLGMAVLIYYIASISSKSSELGYPPGVSTSQAANAKPRPLEKGQDKRFFVLSKATAFPTLSSLNLSESTSSEC